MFISFISRREMLSSSTESDLASLKDILSSAAPIVAAIVAIAPALYWVFNTLHNIYLRWSSEVVLTIDEFNGLEKNEIYEAADVFLGKRMLYASRRLNLLTKTEKTAGDDKFPVMFQGFKLEWVRKETSLRKSRSLEITFKRKHLDKVLDNYIPRMLQEAKKITQESENVKVFTVNLDEVKTGNPHEAWTSAMSSRTKFDNLLIDTDVKKQIEDDLQDFEEKNKENRIYLLDGPPAIGKFSVIAAMADRLNCSIYYLVRKEILNNSQFYQLLLGTSSRCILVVDCELGPEDTLSGLLNILDRPRCGEKRLIVFTMDYQKCDPALLCRIDMQIHLTFCTTTMFRTLVKNYLDKDMKDHPLFAQINTAIQATQVTPAELAKLLLEGGGDQDSCLENILDFLIGKTGQNEEKLKKEAGQSSTTKQNGKKMEKTPKASLTPSKVQNSKQLWK